MLVAAEMASRREPPEAAAAVLKITRHAWFPPKQASAGPALRRPQPARAPLKRDYLRLLSMEL